LTLARNASVLLAAVSTTAGIALALNHPLWPMGMLVLLWCILVLELGIPGAWLLLVPGCLPFMNFSPWTGWIAFEELDIVLLAVLAGGYGRWALFGNRTSSATISCWGPRQVLWSALALTGIAALMRGVADAGGWSFDWFSAYTQALNSVRVFKSLGFALLLWPLLNNEQQKNAAQAQGKFALGMVLGLVSVSLSVLWERAGFVGLWNFSANYRTVALFWEMHVGGAAIDAYLAMAAPFAVWALVSAKGPGLWSAAAVLILIVGYACLTTFSRGVYLSVVCALLLLAYLVRRPAYLERGAKIRWRVIGGIALLALLSLEVFAVLGGDSYMQKRLAKSEQDMGSRIGHWIHGVELLNGGQDWWMGKGLGRLPANYSSRVEGENFSGDVHLAEESDGNGSINRFATLTTPPNWDQLPGVYALTQRIHLTQERAHSITMNVRVREPVDVTVQLCQRHLLYDRNCQGASMHVEPHEDKWQTMKLNLRGPPLISNQRSASRLLMLVVSVDTGGVAADIDNLHLSNDLGQALLANGDFSRHFAQWLPAAQSYYVPWHIDNLYLELLIERGLIGAIAVGTLFAWAMVSAIKARGTTDTWRHYLAASLFGSLVAGLVSSIQDVPRVALVFYLLPMMLIGCKNQELKVKVD
jgi:hypothetical protein